MVLLTPGGSSVASKNNNTIDEACFLDFLDEHASNFNLNDTTEDDDANTIDEVTQLLDDFVREEEESRDEEQTVTQVPIPRPKVVTSSPSRIVMPEIPNISKITRNMIPAVPAVPVVPLMGMVQLDHSKFVMPTIPTVTMLTLPAAPVNPCTTATTVEPIVDTTTLTRKQRVERWKKKRHRRNWSKKHVKNEYYGLRKQTASKRRRVSGKFSGSSVSWVSCA